MHHATPPADLDEFFIPGGRTITREVFARLCAAGTVAEFAAALPRTVAARCLEEGMARAPEPRRLLALDRALQSCFARETLRVSRREPLSIGFAIGYLWRKAGEVTNLRLIGRGKYAGLPRGRSRRSWSRPGWGRGGGTMRTCRVIADEDSAVGFRLAGVEAAAVAGPQEAERLLRALGRRGRVLADHRRAALPRGFQRDDPPQARAAEPPDRRPAAALPRLGA